MLAEAQVNMPAAEEAQRRLAISQAEKHMIARRMEHDETVVVEDAQKMLQHDEANAAGVADEANWRLAQEGNEKLRIQNI
eukprot:3411558-Pyramimonas_sp.AAC.1